MYVPRTAGRFSEKRFHQSNDVSPLKTPYGGRPPPPRFGARRSEVCSTIPSTIVSRRSVTRDVVFGGFWKRLEVLGTLLELPSKLDRPGEGGALQVIGVRIEVSSSYAVCSMPKRRGTLQVHTFQSNGGGRYRCTLFSQTACRCRLFNEPVGDGSCRLVITPSHSENLHRNRRSEGLLIIPRETQLPRVLSALLQ